RGSTYQLGLSATCVLMRPIFLSVLSQTPDLILANVAHELRLQTLRTKFSANMQRAFADRNLFVPRGDVQHRLVEVNSGGPHQPPPVRGLFKHSTVWAGTPIER